ncbi:MAG TPA: carboxylesterase family protein [Rhizomicrobium sp.]
MRVSIAILFLLLASPATAAPQVTIAQGTLAGTSDTGIDAYKNIPYARPPLGLWRWRSLQAGPRWSGVRDASAFGPICPQEAQGLVARANLPQSEDCLTLNVWAPQGGAKHPVMVWIHGGGFSQGGASVPLYDGAALARRGVVVVSFNYRLGRLGFFVLPELTQEHPGEDFANYGLLDQIRALEWVKQNIASFGGDAANVTVFGESAGGVSVDILMTSPRARGLFARAISESGPALGGVVSLGDAQRDGLAFAAKLGASGPGALKKLRAAGVAQILAAGDEEIDPILDGTLLREDVAVAFAKGHAAAIPYLTGTNSDEGAMLNGDSAEWLTKPLGDQLASVRALYETGGKLSDTDFGRLLFNDHLFAASARLLAGFAARAGAPSYVYRFGFLSARAHMRAETGVPHGGEMSFVFGFGPLAPFAPPQDVAVEDRMQAYWTNFARSGDPNGPGLPLWPKFSGPAPSTLVIDDKTEAVPDFRKAQLDVALRQWSLKTGMPLP